MKRWWRWLASGFVSMATPLPWVVDVTSQRFADLERRVAELEKVSRETPRQFAKVSAVGMGNVTTWTTSS